MTIDELADRIVAWEDQRSATQSSPDRRDIRAELHDVDLPALDERGVIDFNADEGIVGSHSQDHDPIVRFAEDDAGVSATPLSYSGPRTNSRSFLAFAVVAALAAVLLTAFVVGEAVAALLFAGFVALVTLVTATYRLTRGREST